MANRTAKTKAKTAFLDLPNELVLNIADLTHSQQCHSHLSRTNRRLHQLLTDELLRRNVRDDGSSAVVWAFHTMHLEMLRRLYRYGAILHGPKTMLSVWDSLLTQATRDGNIVMVKVLVDLGVDTLRRCDGLIPLWTAISWEQDEVAKFLIALLPSLDFPVTGNGLTALLAACEYRRDNIVRYLLSKGADANFKMSGKGLSTFDYMIDGCWIEDDFDMLTLLLENGAEPDDEACTRGATSTDSRVRRLFNNREISVSKRKVANSRPRKSRKASGEEVEAANHETGEHLSPPVAQNRSSTGRDAFPALSKSHPLSESATHQAWTVLNEPPAERFPLLHTKNRQEKNTANKESMYIPDATTDTQDQAYATPLQAESDSNPSSPKTRRKRQKLQL